MKPHRSTRSLRRLLTFCGHNKQLLIFTVFIMIGAVFGSVIYSLLPPQMQTALLGLLYTDNTPSDFQTAVFSALSGSFGIWLHLTIIFLLGLTAFGCPLVLLFLLFFGICFGTAECQAFAVMDGWDVLLNVTLPMAVSSVAILLASMDTFQLSCAFARQLLPTGAHCGGMWKLFKRHLLIFVLCILITVLSSTLRVIVSLF